MTMHHLDLTDQAFANDASHGRRPRAEAVATLSPFGAQGLARLIGGSLKAAGKIGRRAATGLVRWHEQRAAIRELMALDDRMLKDIGMQRSQIGSVVDELLSSTPSATGATTRPVERIGAVPSAPQTANDDKGKRAA